MTTDLIREHLRKALGEIVNAEKLRLHQLYDTFDAEHVQRVAKLKPLLEALRVLSEEIGNVEGVQINLTGPGHMAIVTLRIGASYDSFSLSTSIGNRCFTVEERKVYSFSNESFEKRYELDDGEAALEILIKAIGQHVAQVKVLDERQK